MQSPSFNRYSSGTLEDVAARVVAEFPDHFENDTVFYLDDQNINNKENQNQNQNKNDEKEEEEKEFEFPSLLNRHVSFPIFGREILMTEEKKRNHEKKRSSLWKLMREEERETCSSTTSSEEERDELEGVAEESYCVWTPATAGKSLSTGTSSKRWRVRDLLLFRSNSDGINIR